MDGIYTYSPADKRHYDILTALAGPGVSLPGLKRLITGYIRTWAGVSGTLVVTRLPLAQRGHATNQALRHQVKVELDWLRGRLPYNAPLYQAFIHWVDHSRLALAAMIAPPQAFSDRVVRLLTEGEPERTTPDPELMALSVFVEALARWTKAVTLSLGERLDPASGLPVASPQPVLTWGSLIAILDSLFEASEAVGEEM